jgi:putative ABC transport system substrate-binding protein
MFNPDTAAQYYLYLRSFETVPRSIAVEVTAAPVRDTAEIEAAIAKLGRELGGGLIVAPDGFTTVHQHLFIRLAQQHRLPAVYALRTFVAQGALMSYGPNAYDWRASSGTPKWSAPILCTARSSYCATARPTSLPRPDRN